MIRRDSSAKDGSTPSTSAQAGGRVMKRTASPLKGARRNELVEDVVDRLRPWKNYNSRDTVTAAVNENIDLLIEFVPLHTKLGDFGPIRTHAKKLKGALN